MTIRRAISVQREAGARLQMFSKGIVGKKLMVDRSFQVSELKRKNEQNGERK